MIIDGFKKEDLLQQHEVEPLLRYKIMIVLHKMWVLFVLNIKISVPVILC